jgi:uncharacterized protein
MLLRFRFSNFRSFRAGQELSMVAGAVTGQPETVRHPKGIEEGVLPVAAIYGANASGKTNVLRAMQFMQGAVKDSHARWEPDKPNQFEPFAGEPNSPATFSVDFVLSGVRYQYGFSVIPEAILAEWLHAYPRGKKQTWFDRKKGKPMSFSARLQGDNRTIERLTRPNSLYLSAAAQNNHPTLAPVYKWFSQSLAFVRDDRSIAWVFAGPLLRDASFQRKVARLHSSADLGITELRTRELTEQQAEVTRKVVSFFTTEFKAAVVRGQPGEPDLSLQFLHRFGDTALPFSEEQESKGTIAFLCLIEPAVRALADGGVLWVDELDQSLHPLLAIKLIRQFNDPKNNPASAQLVFNTHDTNLLSAGVLRRDQIWFTEKQKDGASQLYPLTDFKPRKQENLENGYLQGRYGAIPFLNADRFLAGGHEEER